MPDIFDVSVPPWLADLTRSSEKGLLGSIAGGLVAGGVVAAEHATEPDEKRNWFQLLPQSIGEAKMSFLDPLWKLKLQQTQLNMAHTGLQMQEMQQQIDANKTKIRLTAEDTANIPKWLQEHPTIESRMEAEWPAAKTSEWNKNLDQLRLRDSQSTQAKVVVSGVKNFADRISALSKDDPAAAAQIAGASGQYTQRGQMPPSELLQSLSYAEQAAQQRKENERNTAIAAAQAAGQVPETRITDKGITTIYKPTDTTITANKARVGTEMTTPSGIHAVWIGPNQIRITEKSGSATDFTPGQLLQYAAKFKNSANANSRATAQEIEKFIGEKAKEQVERPITKAPVAGTNTPASKPIAVTGQGTREDPAKPTTQQQFDSMPSKSWFINPKDGKLLQKK